MPSPDTATQSIELAHTGGSTTAYVARPVGDGPFPGVVVIHDITGMRADTERHCRNFAEAGYVAVAPDLYEGGRIGCVVRTVAAMIGGPSPPAIEASRSWLVSRPEVDAGRIGIIGFCMGGGFALAAAAEGPYAVTGPFYGMVPLSSRSLQGLCPTIAQAGRQDLVFASAARRLDRHLAALGVEGEVHVHPGVGHSFMNDHPELGLVWRLQRYGPMRVFHDPPTEQRAWRLLLAYFDRHLRPGSATDG